MKLHLSTNLLLKSIFFLFLPCLIAASQDAADRAFKLLVGDTETIIDRLPYTIEKNGRYSLARSLTMPYCRGFQGGAIRVTAAHCVILDLQGHTLGSENTNGIFASKYGFNELLAEDGITVVSKIEVCNGTIETGGIAIDGPCRHWYLHDLIRKNHKGLKNYEDFCCFEERCRVENVLVEQPNGTRKPLILPTLPQEYNFEEMS